MSPINDIDDRPQRANLPCRSAAAMRPLLRFVRLTLCASVALLSATTSGAQTVAPRISIGGIELQLGMPQEEALRKLSVLYRVQDLSPGSWVVLRENRGEYAPLGSITFTDDRLTFASRSWTPPGPNQSADSLARAFFDAVRSMTGGGTRTCLVATSEQSTTVGTMRQIELTCQGRIVTIAAVLNSNTVVGIDETIRTQP
jgi:hypothetical protein